MTDALAALRAAFPVAGSWIYFNHAAVAPLSLPAARAMHAFLDEMTRQGSTGFRAWEQTRERARASAAQLLGARPDELAFVTSTSQGLLTVAEGLTLGAGDEILVVEGDFPANLIPWYRQQRRGARVVEVPRSDGRVSVASILSRLSAATRLVAVPYVLWDTGYRLDLVALGQALADHPALFCVDAIQGLGAFPLDVQAARIDFLAADSHKWMLGLEGIGLFYCRQAALEQLDPPLQSWLSVPRPLEPWHPGKPLRPDARRFEFATMPTLALYGLDATLRLLLDTGVGAMAERILALTGRLAAGLVERGWRLASPVERDEERSGILSAVHPTREAGAVGAALAEQGVCVADRAGAVRFSPHAWNTPEEVDGLLERLA